MAYVYRHIRLDTGFPFYVGVGETKNYTRAKARGARSIQWKEVVKITDFNYEILEDNITIQEAKIKEKEYIALYGRVDLGTGHLVNRTEGGDGLAGYIFTEEYRMNLRAAMKKRILPSDFGLKRRGKKLNHDQEKWAIANISRSEKLKGRKLSDFAVDKLKERIGKNNPMYGKQNTGKFKGNIEAYKDGLLVGVFRGTYECAKNLNIQPSKIGSVLSGKRNHTGGYTFKRMTA